MNSTRLLSPTRRHAHGLALAALAITIALSCASSLPAAPPANTLRTFNYTEGGQAGTIVEGPNGIWTQTNPVGTKFTFKYAGASDEYVELLDAQRDISIRIYAQGFTIRSRGLTTYRPYAQGQWVFTKVAAPKPVRPLAKASGTGKTGAKPGAPRVGPRGELKLVYFVANDREPTTMYREKILTLLSVAEQVYRAEFERRGWPFEGFPYELDKDGKPAVHLIYGKQQARDYNDYPDYDSLKQWGHLVPEINDYLKNDHRPHLTLAFAETYDSGPAPREWPGGISLAIRYPIGGGLGVCSAWMLKDELCTTDVEAQLKLLADETLMVGRTASHTGKPDSPRGEFVAAGVGSIIRQLGNAQGLMRDLRKTDQELMGYGARSLRNNFDPTKTIQDRAQFSDDNAMILRASYFLNPDLVRGDVVDPQAKITIVDPTAETVEVQIDAADDRGLKGIVLYDRIAESIVDGKELKGTQVVETFTAPLKRGPDGNVSIRVLVLDAAGNRTTVDGP